MAARDKASVSLFQFGAGLVLVAIGVPLIVLSALQGMYLLLAIGIANTLSGLLWLTGWTVRTPRRS